MAAIQEEQIQMDITPTWTGVHTFNEKIELVGGQLVFPASQSASADANTLDDYEEGAWDATFSSSGGGTITINASYDTGAYVKVGKLVTVSGHFLVDSVGVAPAPSGYWYLNGLPFTCLAAYGAEVAVALNVDVLEAAAATSIVGLIINNTTRIRITKFAAGAQAFCAGDVKAGTVIYISATYQGV